MTSVAGRRRVGLSLATLRSFTRVVLVRAVAYTYGMRTWPRVIIPAVALALGLAGVAQAHGGPPVNLEDVQVTIRVLTNGDLDVTERVQVRADQPGSVRWPVGGRRASDVSGLSVVSATPATVRDGVEVDGFEVGWLVPAGVSAVTVRYRVDHVITIAEGRSQLRWDAVPWDRDEVIGIAKVIVQLPQAYDPAELATDLDTAPANTNTQHRVLNSRTLYYEGRTLAPGTTLTIIGRWPASGANRLALSVRQWSLVQPLAVALLALLAAWWGYRGRRSMKHAV